MLSVTVSGKKGNKGEKSSCHSSHTDSILPFMRRGLLLFATSMFLCILGINIYISTAVQKEVQAAEGQAVLPETNGLGNQALWISGEWNFYPREFLSVHEFSSSTPAALDITKGWNDAELGQDSMGQSGWGTYHLHISLPRTGRFSLMIPWVNTAYQLYIDDTLVASVGRIGEDPQNHTPAYRPLSVDFTAHRIPVDIVFHISNFDHFQGGLVNPILIGEEKQIASLFTLKNAASTFIFGGMVTAALMMLMLFSPAYREKRLLYIAGLAFLLALRSSLGSSMLIYRVFPAFPWELGIRIEYITLPLAAFCYIGFFRNTYIREFSGRMIRFLQWGAAVCAVLITVLPVSFFGYMLLIIFSLIILVVLYWIFTVLYHRIWQKDYPELIITGAAVFSIGVFLDLLNYTGIIPHYFPLEFSSISLLAFIFLLIFIYTGQFLRTLAYSRELTSDLEVKVEQRTNELKEANERLYQMAVKDDLTDLWNRTELDRRSQEESYRHNRYAGDASLWFSVLYIDLDNFKYFNDTYTHEAGDLILKHFARLMNSCSRKTDSVFRIGGDEFLMFLPKTDEQGAANIAGRIIGEVVQSSAQIETILSHHLGTQIAVPASQQLTCSVGIACHKGENLSIERLIQYADTALLQAKLAGKNQFHLYRQADLKEET